MRATLRRPLLFLLSAALCALASSEPIELFYFVNQKAYRVTEFERGVPKLGEELALENTDFNGERHRNWWFKGSLPLTIDKAIPLVDYRVKRVAPDYRERLQPMRYEVTLDLPTHVKSSPWLEKREDVLLVVGWQLEGTISEIFVSTVSARVGYDYRPNLTLDEHELEGFPFCWIVADGEALPKDEIAPWDALFFPGDSGIDFQALAQARDATNRTALHYAAGNGLVSAVRALLAADSKIVKASSDGFLTALSFAAECGRSEVSQVLFEVKSPLEDGWEKLGSTIRRAAEHGHFEVVKALAPGKPKGSKAKWHYSWAASDALNENYEDVALYLLDLGADFTLENEERVRYTLGKFSNGQPELGFKLLERFKLAPTLAHEGFGLLHAVASYADLDLLEQTRALGVVLDQKTRDGLLPMDFAVALGNVEAICWFIDNGGRSDPGSGGIDPVQHAIKEGQKDSVQCLINYGYDVNRQVAEGITPLMYAAFRGETGIALEISRAGGVWDLSSPHLDFVMTRLLAVDASELVASILQQGWAEDRRLSGELTLFQAARFYEASAVESLLLSQGWKTPENAFFTLKQVDQAPKLAAPLDVRYPDALQSSYGDKEVLVDLIVGSSGQTLLAKILGSELPLELRSLVEPAVYGLSFVPAVKEDQAVPVAMRVRVPLKSDLDPKEVFNLVDVDEPPRVIQQGTPTYPRELAHSRKKGQVVIGFVLMADGSVRNASVVQSSHPAFSEAALSAVKRTLWQPALKNGVKVPCRVRIPINFFP